MLFCVLECEFEKFCSTAASYLIIKTSCSFLCFTSHFHTVSCFGNFSCLSREKTHKNTGKWPFGSPSVLRGAGRRPPLAAGEQRLGSPAETPSLGWGILGPPGYSRACEPLNGCLLGWTAAAGTSVCGLCEAVTSSLAVGDQLWDAHFQRRHCYSRDCLSLHEFICSRAITQWLPAFPAT